MTEGLTAEVLSAHANGLGRAEDHAEEYMRLFPELRDELASLFELAGEVKRVLVPARPAPAFRERLHHDLLQTAEHALAEPLPSRPAWQGVMLRLAALGSALSVAGLLGYLLALRRARSHPLTPA
jgi:hypothetical protein